jgi:hypothetical protein
MWTILIQSLHQGEKKMPETKNLPVNTDFVPAIFTALGTKCPHCGQEFSEEAFHIAIFLYGIFFLVGKEHGYVGITCPNCLNSFLLKSDITHQTSIINTPFLKIGTWLISPNFVYFSPFYHDPRKISELNLFTIHTYGDSEVSDFEDFIGELNQYLKKSLFITEEFLCSAIIEKLTNESIIGENVNIYWFKETEIDRLVLLENTQKIKIFPRYYLKKSFIQKIDRFCWKNYLYSKYLEDVIIDQEKNLEKLKEYAGYNGIELDRLCDINEHNSTINRNRSSIIEIKENEGLYISTPSDLVSILVDDLDLNSMHELRDIYTFLYTTKYPFLNKNSSISLWHFEFDRNLYHNTLQNHSDMVKVINYSFQKEKVQTYLREASAQFITQYLDASKNLPFSIADIWSMKEKHLKELYTIVREQAEFQSKNRFYREDGLWVIVYQGKTIRLKDLKGFAYMQFLVSKTNKDYSYDDLHNLLDGERQNPEKNEVAMNYNELSVTTGKTKINERMISLKRLQWMQRVRPKIEGAIVKTTQSGNEKRVDRLEGGISKFDDYCKKFLPKNGSQAKTYTTNYAYKSKKDKVDRDIKYALKYLETIDEKAWKHFRFSIKNRLGRIGYELSEGPGWLTG